MKTLAPILSLLIVSVLNSVSAETQTNQMVIRSYVVSPGIFKEAVPLSVRHNESETVQRAVSNADIKKLFEDSGVPFPDGSRITYNERANRIFVLNTPENLDTFERVLNVSGCIVSQVEVEAKLVRVCDRKVAEGLTAATLTNALPGKVEVIDRISAMTISGAQTQSKRWQTLKPKTAQTASIPPCGIELNFTPTVGPDGYTINVTVIWEYRHLNGWVRVPRNGTEISVPDITHKSLTTSIVIWDGESMILNITDGAAIAAAPGHKGEEQCPEFLVVTARLLDEYGLPKPMPDPLVGF